METSGPIETPLAIDDRARPGAAAGKRYPCSAAQRRFWLLNQLYPGTPALHVALRWRLEGELSTSHLEQAFRQMLERHEVLRASFAEQDGALYQTLHGRVPFRIPEIDLARLPRAEALAEAERIAELEARAAFDLSAAPPFIRATRLVLAAAESVLLVTAHHIVMDGWSSGVLARELGTLCAALQEGRSARLAELPLGFGDHCRREAQGVAASDVAADEDYWRSTLRGMSHFELPTDHLRAPVKSAKGRICSMPLDAALGRTLPRFAAQHGCTLFMAAAAALLTLLHRYTGETDIGIGTQTPGRDEPELESLIGPFINTLVLRHDLSGDPSFAELLERVQDTVGAAFEHQQLPVERVIELVGPQRDLSRAPLLSVNFTVQRPYVRDADYGRFRLIDLPPLSTGLLYDLSFSMTERPQGWEIACEYDAELFERQTVMVLLRGFDSVLRGAVADPSRPLSVLPVMDPAGRDALLRQCNDTAAEYPRDRTVVSLFEEQASLRPDAPALLAGSAALSYAELEAAANRLAHELRHRQLGRGCLIGLFLDRSPELVIALLAVLKAGAAYLPIDPAYPQDRIAYVVSSSGLAALLTRQTLRDRLGSLQAPVLLLDQEAASIAGRPVAAPEPAAAPQDPAYVIYTSGSTGKPKGVQIAHRSLLNLLWCARRQPGLSAGQGFLSVSSIAFDIATLELLLPLCAGGRLILATDEQAASGERLRQLLDSRQVDAMFATPATWQMLLLAGWEGTPGLKMLCGGEPLPRQLADALLQRGGELWNLYGPTETTILCSALRVEAGTGPVLLGPPIANTRFHVLDAQGEPVLPGAPGELYIGGDGVGIGYLGQPELTAQRFVPDRFSPAGGPLYRSGDMVRARAGGRLEFLGRSDGQVKLRGFRIELGEIEAGLLAQPEVAEAVVQLRSDVAGGAIVAYVVPRPGQEPVAAQRLRDKLSRFLPKYMCPASYVVLDALPRMPNGKIDRKALPAPAPGSAGAAAEMDPTEQLVAAIWQELLGVGPLRRDANFFELGGHSLLAAQMLAQIRQRCGQQLSLSVLFQQPTVQGLAAALKSEGEREFDFRQVIKLQPNGTRAPLIAINNTGIYGLLAKRLGSERPFTSLQLFDPELRDQPLPGSLEEIAEHYVRLIRRVQPHGPYALLGWCVAGTLAFEIARQLHARQLQVQALFMIDTYVPRYFERMSPLRRPLARYSHRLQLVAADWASNWRQGHSLKRFVARRSTFKKALKWLGRVPAEAAGAGGPTGEELYDQWLLQYLYDAAERYEPRPYAGRIVLFRNAGEPRGGFLGSSMGWRGLAQGGVDVVDIDGDHFSMFRDPGVGQMARCIARMLDAGAVGTDRMAPASAGLACRDGSEQGVTPLSPG